MSDDDTPKGEALTQRDYLFTAARNALIRGDPVKAHLLLEGLAAKSDIRIIQALPVPAADKEALTTARARLASMTSHDIDVVEGSLSPKATRHPDFNDIPEDAVRAFIASERAEREKKAEAMRLRTERGISIVGFVITNIVVIVAAVLSQG